jgi:hypothetical protein
VFALDQGVSANAPIAMSLKIQNLLALGAP